MNDYPDSLDVRPISTWVGSPTLERDRRRSQFSAPLRTTLTTLDRELWHLQAVHPVLEVAIPVEQFRRDGRPRAQAKADHPGVILSLPKTSVGPLRYAADTFTTWQDNLRAIALGLEALRKVDRYGITKRGEQYAGFKQLGSGSAVVVEPTLSVDEAARELVTLAGRDGTVSVDLVVRDAAWHQSLYRLAARRHHPDHGGERASWDRLERAKRVLDEHSGRA